MDRFERILDSDLVSGRRVPDVFALESSCVRKYVESGLLLDLTDIYERNRSRMLAYPAEVGMHNGRVYALSWQACPGAMFYRRSLARRYLGTDDPATVQTYFANFEKLLKTTKRLNSRSGGACVLVASYDDLFFSFLGARSNPWIVNNRLHIDPIIEQYMEMGKIFHDNRYDGSVGQWSESWFEGMKGELRNTNGKLVEVFSYFLPTWGLHYVLKNAPRTSGDWAMIPGPSPYHWGGTWLGAYKNTENAEAARQMIEWITTNDDFLRRWARDTGDMVSNTVVIDSIKNDFSEPFLGGQNHYAEFAEIARNVNGSLRQSTDERIQVVFLLEALTAYINGEKTKSQALDDFRRQVEDELASEK
jgi:ABC-type glycerol-3-phosphate transport system substrate-binding protein